MANFYVYLHCKPDGAPFYVGKGGGASSGKRSHFFGKRNTYHRRVIEKYGAENIGVFVFPCESEEVALADEIQHIAQLKRDGYILCNQTAGGEGLKDPSIEIREKIAIATKNLWADPAHREKMVLSKLGKKHTKEHNEKIGLAHKGKKRSQEYCERMSILRTGEKRSEESRKRMSESAKISTASRMRDASGRYL